MCVALLHLEMVSFTILKKLSLYIRSVIFFKLTLILGNKWETELIQWKRFWHARTINTNCSIVVRKEKDRRAYVVPGGWCIRELHVLYCFSKPTGRK